MRVAPCEADCRQRPERVVRARHRDLLTHDAAIEAVEERAAVVIARYGRCAANRAARIRCDIRMIEQHIARAERQRPIAITRGDAYARLLPKPVLAPALA